MTRVAGSRSTRCASSTTRPWRRTSPMALRAAPTTCATTAAPTSAACSTCSMRSACATSSTIGSSAASTTTRAPRSSSSIAGREGQQHALGGGGRYDGLAELLGGRPTPGIGFGIGLDRTVLAMEEQGVDAPAVAAARRGRRRRRRPRRSASGRRHPARRAASPCARTAASRKLGKQLEAAAKAGAALGRDRRRGARRGTHRPQGPRRAASRRRSRSTRSAAAVRTEPLAGSPSERALQLGRRRACPSGASPPWRAAPRRCPGPSIISFSAFGTICHERPNRSFSQPHGPGSPPSAVERIPQPVDLGLVLALDHERDRLVEVEVGVRRSGPGAAGRPR